jgi:hypothetical protein
MAEHQQNRMDPRGKPHTMDLAGAIVSASMRLVKCQVHLFPQDSVLLDLAALSTAKMGPLRTRQQGSKR